PFSSTSISTMNAHINSVSCFLDRPLERCGNGFVESGEQCDCGSSCASDPWCSTSCTLQSGAQCSPS
ncbi:MAG: hypothetical protein SGJ02_00115, partial [bacterium]|nr:hypothetical protein [bacterium]